jgi:hypothetical protein
MAIRGARWSPGALLDALDETDLFLTNTVHSDQAFQFTSREWQMSLRPRMPKLT